MTERLGLDAALTLIAETVAQRRDRGRRTIVGITGPQGAGKSTFARTVSEGVTGGGNTTDGALRHDPLVISTDRYLPDYSGLTPDEYDLPEMSDLRLLAQHALRLRQGEAVALPIWSFETHAREGYEPVAGPIEGAAVVIEGIHALAQPVRGALDLAVFVEASASERRRRVIAREESGERGWTPQEAAAFFDGVADPVYGRFADVYRAAADLVVINED